MMRGKLIVIEGNDCTGKETQSRLLKERLESEGIPVFTMAFPRYDTPTGRIIGGPLLGKSYICDSYFENPGEVPPKVASLYYSADRLYNRGEILENLNNGVHVILDRYTTSNMGHQAGKLESKQERDEMFEYFEHLEYDMLELPRPDGVILLHMPYENTLELKKDRSEAPDKVENDEKYLRNAESAYLEMKEKYGFKYVPCTESKKIRAISDINDDVYRFAKEIIDGK